MAEVKGTGPIPKEALDYLRSKGIEESFHWAEVYGDEHANAFTVARSAGVDILGDLKQSLDDALAEGKTYRQWAKEITPTLQEKGWWGRPKEGVVDPRTGEWADAQLGSPRRLKTIYHANTRSARAAGRWERIQRTKSTHPYLLYQLGPSREHRPEHVAFEGILLPVDDPFWQTHYPPNGWGCKCWPRQVSRREYERLSGTGKYLTEAPTIKYKKWKNKATGEWHDVPVGIDPGWEHNPGMARQKVLLKSATEKLAVAEPPVAKRAISDLVDSVAFRRWWKKPQGNFPIGVVKAADAERIGAKVQTAVVSEYTRLKQIERHIELDPHEYLLIQKAFDHGEVIQETGNKLIYILETDGSGYVTVVKATREGDQIFVESYRRLSRDQARRDKEIQRLRKNKTKK